MVAQSLQRFLAANMFVRVPRNRGTRRVSVSGMRGGGDRCRVPSRWLRQGSGAGQAPLGSELASPSSSNAPTTSPSAWLQREIDRHRATKHRIEQLLRDRQPPSPERGPCKVCDDMATRNWRHRSSPSVTRGTRQITGAGVAQHAGRQRRTRATVGSAPYRNGFHLLLHTRLSRRFPSHQTAVTGLFERDGLLPPASA
jgi:hypothetical protein